MIFRRRKAARMMVRESDKVLSEGHKKWVRGHECLCAGRAGHICEGKMHAHHATTRGAGGGDDVTVPLCAKAHDEGHVKGWKTFEAKYALNLLAIAAELWKKSPHRLIWERKQAEA